MVKIVSDDPILEAHIQTHVDLLISSGGWVHDDLEIQCHSGDLSIHSAPTINADAQLIIVPEHALAPVNQAELTLIGDEIIFDPNRSNLTDQQTRLLDIQCRIYNLSGKVRKLRQSVSRYLRVDHPALFDALTDRGVPQPEQLHGRASSSAELPDVSVKDFLKSRVLRWPKHGNEDDTTDVLMSLIDYINHDSRATPHQRSSDNNALVATSQRCREKISECFVQYGPYDAQDVLLLHGYLDDSADFVRSTSFSVPVEDLGTVHIGSEIAYQPNKHTVSKGKNRSWSFPSVRTRDDGDLEVSSLFIITETDPMALKRALTLAIAAWRHGLDQPTTSRLVGLLERAVLNETRGYYEKLRIMAQAAQNSVAADMVQKMVSIQLQTLSRYSSAVQ
ncbi:MAG: hypothetical protein HOH65_07245 [Rhodospirillaceae bacterium]|nr:hypothetical protein [Rhodospirillaceae bacterium]